MGEERSQPEPSEHGQRHELVPTLAHVEMNGKFPVPIVLWRPQEYLKIVSVTFQLLEFHCPSSMIWNVGGSDGQVGEQTGYPNTDLRFEAQLIVGDSSLTEPV